MSKCPGTKFAAIQSYFDIKFEDHEWNLNGLTIDSPFQWNGRAENDCILEIISFFSRHIPDFIFIDSRTILIAIEYADNGGQVNCQGKLDISALKPGTFISSQRVVLSQTICVIEIKTDVALAAALEESINQSQLQLLALNMGGNDHLPFALLTNATDYWHFSWLSKNNTMKSIVLKNPRQGLAALKEGLQMMNGKRGKCPFKDRMNFLVPEIGRGGETYTDDVGNMEDFYDEMTEEDIFNYKIKRGFTRMFDAMNPTLRESFKVK